MNQLSTPTLEARLIVVPLARLAEDTNGVRKTNGVSITELAASIAAEGLIQNLTVIVDATAPLAGAGEFQGYTVIAGCRRLRALRDLDKRGRLPADLANGIPCRLVDASQALTVSLAENTVREAMHPADELVAFRDMIDQGKSVDDVSARFGVTPLFVQRRLKLAAVSPKLFEQFRQNKISLAQMMALAIVDDHVAQEKAWKNAKHDHARQPEELRAALTKAEIDVTKDPIARFVGLQEYERAGGHVHRDLFDDKGAGYITDKRLLQELATKKFMAIEEQVRKEGWSFVEVRETISQYNDLNEYSRAQPTSWAKPDGVEKKRVEALTKERAELGKEIAEYQRNMDLNDVGEDRAYEELCERHSSIDAEIEVMKQARTKWDPKILAKGGAMIGLDRRDGNLVIYRGLVKGKLRTTKDAKKGKAATGEAPTQEPGHGKALMRELTAHATFAIAAEMIASPRGQGVAIIALTHQLLLTQFFRTDGYSSAGYARSTVAIRHDTSFPNDPTQAALAEKTSAGASSTSSDLAKLAAERKAIKALIPSAAGELLAWLLQPDNKHITRLLAFCVAESINAVEDVEPSGKAVARAAPLASALKVDMTTRWTAQLENYLNRVNAATIHAALKEAGADKATLGKAEKLKKAALVDLAQPLLKTWLPKPLRFEAAKSTKGEKA